MFLTGACTSNPGEGAGGIKRRWRAYCLKVCRVAGRGVVYSKLAPSVQGSQWHARRAAEMTYISSI